MKKIIPLVASMMLILVVGIFAGSVTMAYFNDTETSSGNTISAGTLDLLVDGENNPLPVKISVENIAPGYFSGLRTYAWVLKNVGTLPGKVSVTFSAITNLENGMNEPESDAEAEAFGTLPTYWGRPTLGHPTDGELGEYLIASLQKDPNVGFHLSNGMGPADGATILGFNGFGGKTYDMSVTLAQGQEVTIYLILRLESDLRVDKYGNVKNINDNVIQSDSVQFDITFRLDQVV